MPTPIFETHQAPLNHTDAFSASFLDQKSYIELLRISDSFFDLKMTTRERALPCQQNSYMVLVRSPPREPRYLWKGIGRKVSLTVNAVVYNERYGVLVALVQLKNNYTCNHPPHIVLAKRAGVNNILVSNVIDDAASRMEMLYSPYRVHGKIGVIFGSGEETITPALETKMVDGLEVRTTNNVVTRPEVLMTVEQPPPTSLEPKFVSYDQFRVSAAADRAKGGDEVMEITLDKKSGGERATGETYQGEAVMEGPRGGKYIMKDGKKKYVPGGKAGKSELIYNINILE
jgi:hypothetical protein